MCFDAPRSNVDKCGTRCDNKNHFSRLFFDVRTKFWSDGYRLMQSYGYCTSNNWNYLNKLDSSAVTLSATMCLLDSD